MAPRALVVVRDAADARDIRSRLGDHEVVVIEADPDDLLAVVARRAPQLEAWPDIEALVARALGELLGTTLHCTPGSSRDLVHTSSIPLTSSLVSLQVGLGIDEHTEAQLRERLLDGDGSGDAVRDALREMANMAGGAIRRAAFEDGMSFAVGLPSNDNPFGAGPRCRAFTVGDGRGFHLECMIAITTNVTARVAAGQLSEGMVLAQHIRVADHIAYHRGTLLTSTSAARIAGLVGASTPIEVSPLASPQA